MSFSFSRRILPDNDSTITTVSEIYSAMVIPPCIIVCVSAPVCSDMPLAGTVGHTIPLIEHIKHVSVGNEPVIEWMICMIGDSEVPWTSYYFRSSF